MIVISFFFFFTKLSSGRINGISVFIPRKWERKREEWYGTGRWIVASLIAMSYAGSADARGVRRGTAKWNVHPGTCHESRAPPRHLSIENFWHLERDFFTFLFIENYPSIFENFSAALISIYTLAFEFSASRVPRDFPYSPVRGWKMKENGNEMGKKYVMKRKSILVVG